MANLMSRGLSIHTSRLHAAAGETITYKRGSSEVELTAARGSSDVVDDPSEGETTVTSRTVDFIVDAEKLRIGGKRIDPDRGDVVVTANGEIYEVEPGISAAPSRFNDGRQTLYRIHTIRRVKSE